MIMMNIEDIFLNKDMLYEMKLKEKHAYVPVFLSIKKQSY